ncbi:MAG: YggS family pyridoxal phosphate-dependent enzyme [Pseudomonadota bacterium]
MNTITQRYDDVTARIEAAAGKSNRSAADITLVAVSKTFTAGDIEPVLKLGHHVFGENRVQESQGKWPALKQAYSDTSLHLIGPLQTNKAREAVALFDAIETLDREKLARTLAKEIQSAGNSPELFIQVNTGNEPQKAGILPDETDAFLKLCTGTYDLAVTGMMCIPPFDEDPIPHFRLLADIAERNGLAKLSMGMSGDFETAIEMGATHVRVGSAIFGSRTQNP